MLMVAAVVISCSASATDCISSGGDVVAVGNSSEA
jgi:hypothetical protein